jgi:hypothetical protein
MQLSVGIMPYFIVQTLFHNQNHSVCSGKLVISSSVRNLFNYLFCFNLGCLHPVAFVKSGDGGFYPSTQRHYLRLILLLILLHVSVVRNILLARITQLTTDPLFFRIQLTLY